MELPQPDKRPSHRLLAPFGDFEPSTKKNRPAGRLDGKRVPSVESTQALRTCTATMVSKLPLMGLTSGAQT
jgi:hypothetical protein